ncbi:MAG: hypothetical protein ACREXP_09510 [Steroidobacteraceae bacterium]
MKGAFSYFLANGKAPEGRIAGESCTPFNPDKIAVARQKEGAYLQEGDKTLLKFSSVPEADGLRAAIGKYGFTHLCKVGAEKSHVTYLRR